MPLPQITVSVEDYSDILANAARDPADLLHILENVSECDTVPDVITEFWAVGCGIRFSGGRAFATDEGQKIASALRSLAAQFDELPEPGTEVKFTIAPSQEDPKRKKPPALAEGGKE